MFTRIGHKFSARRTCLETFEIETCVGYLLGQTRRAVNASLRGIANATDMLHCTVKAENGSKTC